MPVRSAWTRSGEGCLWDLFSNFLSLRAASRNCLESSATEYLSGWMRTRARRWAGRLAHHGRVCSSSIVEKCAVGRPGLPTLLRRLPDGVRLDILQACFKNTDSCSRLLRRCLGRVGLPSSARILARGTTSSLKYSLFLIPKSGISSQDATRGFRAEITPKVLIVDDHATLRRGLRGLLETHPGWECCGEADSGEEAIRAVAESKPDVIIMDVSMPGMGGVKATKIIHEAFPAVRVLLLTLHKSTELLRAGFSAGAMAYVLKSDGEDELMGALETVSRGEIYVTRAISPSAVANVVEEIKRSSGVNTDAQPASRVATSQS